MAADAAVSQDTALVLVVDSHADTRDLYAVWLELNGLRVEQAADGLEAVTKACRLRPLVIVTELMLEEGNRLRECDETRDIPIIVVTGYTSPRLQSRICDLHASAVLLKPCSPDRLLQEIRRVIAGGLEPAA